VSGHDDLHRAGASAQRFPEPFTDRLRLAVAAYLARFKSSSRAHTESDLRCYLSWCAERGLDLPAAESRALLRRILIRSIAYSLLY
jgi:hypothetical protein